MIFNGGFQGSFFSSTSKIPGMDTQTNFQIKTNPLSFVEITDRNQHIEIHLSIFYKHFHLPHLCSTHNFEIVSTNTKKIGQISFIYFSLKFYIQKKWDFVWEMDMISWNIFFGDGHFQPTAKHGGFSCGDFPVKFHCFFFAMEIKIRFLLLLFNNPTKR
jgi:hypothetical protein